MSTALYADRPEWADVTPLQQYENVSPLAPIFYGAEYKDATDYFRGIVQTKEFSQRTLELTEHIIRLNPSHYSAWQYRYQCLIALNMPLDNELDLMDDIAVQHMKTYQVWHHRRLIITQVGETNPSKVAVELAFIATALSEDAKNYHTWSYRQWLLAHFNRDDLWEGELGYVDAMLQDDIRNNSAWHHRFFVIFECGVRKGDEDREMVLKRELVFTKQRIAIAPNNASAWNYLRGLLNRGKIPYSDVREFVEPYTRPISSNLSESEAVEDLENPLPSHGAHLPCAAAIEFLADIHEADAERKHVAEAVQLWKSLAEEHDTIRKHYWEHRIQEATA